MRFYIHNRLSLRSLSLIFVLITIYLCFWFNAKRVHSNATRQMLMLSTGSSPLNDFCHPIGFEVVSMIVGPQEIEMPRRLAEFACIRGFSNYTFSDQDMSDVDFSFLNDLLFLEDLYVENCVLPPRWIRHLDGCSSLRSLIVISSKLTVADIESLSEINTLHLGLMDVGLSDSEKTSLFSSLGEMRALRSLSLEAGDFTQAEIRLVEELCKKNHVELSVTSW